MQSNGGLCPWYKFTGLKAILSGPAGGMVGFGVTCYDDISKRQPLVLTLEVLQQMFQDMLVIWNTFMRQSSAK